MSESSTSADDDRGTSSSRSRRRAAPGVLLLAALAYLPALTAAPGRMPADSKLYLYLDPGRFFGDAATTFDPRQFVGWVPHQHVAYLWPALPWYWSFETLGVPDWIAHRLWIGTLMVGAGLGARRLARTLGLGASAALAAALVYQLSLYVLPYVSRTSVMLLPWAGLGWIVAYTVRAGRRGGWADPAAIALIVVTVGAVNATALAMIVPAPVLWLAHSVWQRTITWRDALVVAVRTAALCAAVSLWWVVMLVVQARSGTDVLPYSESLADVSLTATAPETWRSLGYWLFYVRDPFAAATTESLRYLSSTPSIVLSYALPTLALVALAFAGWVHRRFALLLIGTGLVLAVGVHPIDDSSPLMRLLAGDDESGLALALRSSTRALPLVALGTALALAAAVDALASLRWRVPRVGVRQAAAATVGVLAVANLPALWTGAFVDPALERDQTPPTAWSDAAAALDAADGTGRVLQVPGAEFGAFRWGYTVDQPLPGLTRAPLVTRDLLPLGSAPAMDLVYALDDRFQDDTFEPESLGPVARLLAVDHVWSTNDLAFDRFRTARPEVVRDHLDRVDGIGPFVAHGDPAVNRPDVPMRDAREVGDPRVGRAAPPVELAEIEEPTGVVRARDRVVVVAGSGDGLVDAAASGLLDPRSTVVRYAADLDDPDAALADATAVIVTDSHRDRARHWRSSQDTHGFTEPGGPADGVLRPVSADARLPVFTTDDPATQTVAVQEGPVTAVATGYGEPFAYLPEHRAHAAIDGDPTTAWLVGEHADPVDERLRLEFAEPVDAVVLHQPAGSERRTITEIAIEGSGSRGEVADRVGLDESSRDGTGQQVAFDVPVDRLDLTIAAVAGGVPFTASAVAPVGFTEIEHGLGPTVEVTRPPQRLAASVGARTPLAYVLTRLRADAMDAWRSDPEPVLIRELDLPVDRTFDLAPTVRVDRRSSDTALAELFDWPVVASSRLIGAPRHAGVAAFDGRDDTAWITGFGGALGARLSTESTEPIGALVLEQRLDGFTTITELAVTVGSSRRVLPVTPDADGRAELVVEPPLPAGPVEIEVTGVDPEVTVDRRFGDLVELPAAVGELAFAGRPAVAPVDEQRLPTTGCTPIAEIDGRTVEVTISIEDAGWLDGAPVVATPCDAEVSLAAGTHRVSSVDGDLPVDLDRVVLDDGARDAVADAAGRDIPTVRLLRDDRFHRTVEVRGCPDGCWLVFGEGWNPAWRAAVGGGDLGEPVLVDGVANGWWLPGDEVVVVDVTWPHQRWLWLALLVSALVALGCAVVVVRGRTTRGDRSREHSPPPRLRADRTAPRSATIAAAVAWPVVAALVVGPGWAIAGLIGGVLLLLRPRTRWPELVAAATVATVAFVVVVRERRNAPPPGGGWPGEFADLHGLAMFAVACVLVAAIAADDAQPPTSLATVAHDGAGDEHDDGDADA